MDSVRIALIIVFNHRYDKNIQTLEAIYHGRFQHIYFIIPFYDGDLPNVIPVYENSYYYEGYIAQAYKSYFKEEYSHYFFIADDMMLNPVINENNMLEHLKMNHASSFLPDIRSIHQLQHKRNIRYAYEFDIRRWGVEATNEVPSYNDALKALKRFNFEIRPLKYNEIYDKENLFDKIKRLIKSFTGKKESYELSYPLVGAYSDLVVVSKKSIWKFAHYCGVFAAADLFVEIAIPTALVLSAETISQEKNLEFQGKYLWSRQELKELDQFNNNLSDLLKNFPSGYLYLHPVKLSGWNNDVLIK